MSFCTQQDNALHRRAEQDAGRNVLQMIEARLSEDIGPSFDEAMRRMNSEGKPALMFLKTGSVALGSVMMVVGIHHLVQGFNEKVDDLFVKGPENRNYTRMFAGACGLSAGALLAYLGAVKGPVR